MKNQRENRIGNNSEDFMKKLREQQQELDEEINEIFFRAIQMKKRRNYWEKIVDLAEPVSLKVFWKGIQKEKIKFLKKLDEVCELLKVPKDELTKARILAIFYESKKEFEQKAEEYIKVYSDSIFYLNLRPLKEKIIQEKIKKWGLKNTKGLAGVIIFFVLQSFIETQVEQKILSNLQREEFFVAS